MEHYINQVNVDDKTSKGYVYCVIIFGIDVENGKPEIKEFYTIPYDLEEEIENAELEIQSKYSLHKTECDVKFEDLPEKYKSKKYKDKIDVSIK